MLTINNFPLFQKKEMVISSHRSFRKEGQRGLTRKHPQFRDGRNEMAEADKPDFESFRIAVIERLGVIFLVRKDGGFPGF